MPPLWRCRARAESPSATQPGGRLIGRFRRPGAGSSSSTSIHQSSCDRLLGHGRNKAVQVPVARKRNEPQSTRGAVHPVYVLGLYCVIHGQHWLALCAPLREVAYVLLAADVERTTRIV